MDDNTTTTFTNFDIGSRIWELRTQRSMSQESLALAAEITPTYLGELEHNKKNPTVRVIEKISYAMGITLADFFDGSTPSLELDDLSLQILSQVRNRTDDEKRSLSRIIRYSLRLRDIKD